MRERTLALLLLVLALAARPGLAAPPEQPLRVGLAGSPPFLMEVRPGDDTPRGLSVQVWEAAAKEMGVDYKAVRFDSVPSLLEALEKGDVDIGVGPLSITAERAERVSFTQPYYRTGLGILAHTAPPSLLHRVRPFMNKAFVAAVSGLVVILALVGLVVWLAERRENPEHFPPGFFPGVGNGMWLALVTMTTVGYGDRAPTTATGRVVTGAWMLISMVTVSTLTAGLATAFTLSQLEAPTIRTPSMLAGRPVAVVEGSTGEDAADERQAQVISARDLPSAVTLVMDQKAEALVHDKPILQYYAKSHPELPVKVAESTFEAQNYGFALPLGSPWVQKANVALLKLAEAGAIDEFERNWLLPTGDED